MRFIIVIIAVLYIDCGLFAQIDNDIESVKSKDSCYLRYNEKGEQLTGIKRYGEWQCGKIVGIVDCNNRLEYDQESDIVYLNSQDMTNLSGAGKPFNGTCETCYMNGVLERRVTFVNGKEVGIDTSYYISGCPQVIRNHINGTETGQWIYFYDSTQYVAWEMNYILGEKHGKHIFFKKNGDTTRWENYKHGLLDGIKRSYYPDSKIKREVTYKNGFMDGSFTIYNLNGLVIEKLNFKRGKKHEECYFYYEDGKPLKIENWNYGVKNGEFKVFYYNGNIQTSENYVKGIKEGWFMEFYQDSKTKRKALYKKDELLEERRYDGHGRETYSFGVSDEDEFEDDEVPER
jgi:antitoxin component YwqK of YwqJK toxin-antitoxin module